MRPSGSARWPRSAGRPLPVVAIGGITLEAGAAVARAGASAAALIAAMTPRRIRHAAGRAVAAAFAVL